MSTTITTTGTGSITLEPGTHLIEAWGPGQSGDGGVEDDPDLPGNQGSGGVGGAGGGFGAATLVLAVATTLYYRVGAADETTWFNPGTNAEAAASGGYSVGSGSTRTPASGQSFTEEYNGGSGGTASGLQGGGGGGGAGDAGAGSNGGNAPAGTGGAGGAGGGGAGGNAVANSAGLPGSAPGGGGGGAARDAAFSPGAGAPGQLRVTSNLTTSLAAGSYAMSGGSITFVHHAPLPLNAGAYSMGGGAVSFLHAGRTTIDAGSYDMAGGAITFLHAGSSITSLAAGSYLMVGSDITFSTGGGAPPAPTVNLVLPNRAGRDRTLPATWESLRFRNFDSVPTRTQKLELLREHTDYIGRHKTITLSFTGGMPSADPAEPLIRMELLEAMEIGDLVATAGVAATGTVILRFMKDGLANGGISFTGTTGTDTGIGDYPAGSLLEIYPPVVADPTLDDVSISIPVIIG